MATIRVTQNILTQRVLTNLRDQNRRILGLQTQLATGQRINRPSEGPLAARLAVGIRREIQRNEQYIENINTTSPFLQSTATTTQSLIDIYQRVRELTIQGGSETNGPQQRAAIAEEINQLLDQVFSTANQRTNGRFLYSGTRTRQAPFEATRDAEGRITAVDYVGNDNAIRIAVAEGVELRANETGRQVFLNNQDIFQNLIDIRDDLLSGNTADLTNARLAEIGVAEEQILNSLARTGATQNRLERIDSDTRDFNFQLQETLSNTLDADFAEVIVNLNQESNALQAALNGAARIIQPSLLNFLG
jgi:flagellar hook-associated protein 3 FlgL